MDVSPIDLLHLGSERAIGCYLLETDDGPALFDCGPATCLDALKQGLAARGLALRDLRHLLLSHIHLDHAGAAGSLVREHPGLQVHVSEIGARHVVDPSRLEASARRLYGEAFDVLWGELAPVPAANVHVVGERVLGFDCFAAPGHASHHVCYLDAGGTLWAGDATGVRIEPGSYVLPVCPPPDLDVEAWNRTIDEIERRTPQRLALIHFGVFEDVAAHLGRLREELARYAEIGSRDVGVDEFVAEAQAGIPSEERDLYEHVAPLAQCYLGMRRYWDTRCEAAERAQP